VNYQIKIGPDGLWHRRQGTKTACGKPVSGAFASRDHQLDEHLCTVCFTPNERDTGEMLKLEAEALERASVESFGEAEDEPTDPDVDVEKL